MKHFYSFAIGLTALLLAVGCRQGRVATTTFEGDTLHLKYAENIVIVRDSLLTKVELRDPWNDGRTLHTYWLIDRSRADEIDLSVFLDGTVVRVPLQRSVVFNTAHASLLQMLNADEAIAGVADVKYMLLPEIQRRVALGKDSDGRKNASDEQKNALNGRKNALNGRKNGLIVDCGDAMAPDIEKIVELDADAILLSPFENSGGYGILEKIGVPVIECAEYMETSALGRAEWMRFYGLLFGCEAQADSLFAVVEREYFSLSRNEERGARSGERGTRNEEGGARLSILTERLTGGTWYVAGGRSSVGRLIADAGGAYAWADDAHSGSLPLSFETVLDKAGDADVWIFNYTGAMPLTRKMLAAEHHGYAAFKAFQTGEIYYVNSLQVPYFEEVSFRPDWLLRDYVILLNPSKQNNQKLRYFQKIKGMKNEE